MKKNYIIISVVILLALVIGIVLIKNKKAIDSKKVVIDRSNIAIAVSVAKAEKQLSNTQMLLPATLEPAHQADISATMAGKLTSFPIQLGSHISAGQVIGSIDIRQQQINLKDAQSALEKAQRDYQLNKELFEGNAGTQQSVKDAQRNVESARARLQQLSQQVGDGRIKAPISGVVTVKNAEVGEYANPGAVLATVVDVFNLKAVVFVGETEVYQLKLNQEASITVDVLAGKTFSAKVSYIAPVGDENHNYRVELSVNNRNAQLKAGTYIKVHFNLENKVPVLQIPKIALVEGTKNPYVYVAKVNKAEMRKIVVGRESGELIEVLSGLQEGEEVVVSGQINISNGSKIERTAAIK